jgi:hypothetical protein
MGLFFAKLFLVIVSNTTVTLRAHPIKSVFFGYFASKEPPKRTLESLIYIEIALSKYLKLNLASCFLFARV